MKCVEITVKGVRCKNNTKAGGYCTLHAKQQVNVATKVNPKPQVKDELMVFNPYYETYVPYNGQENCGVSRRSLNRIIVGQENELFVSTYCDVLPLSKITNVIGPVSYNEYRYKNYNIAIFGEQHIIKKLPDVPVDNTLNFSSFLESVITQNPRQFDFFLESPYKKIDISGPLAVNTIFNIIHEDFKKCLSVVKVCPFKNLRTHYIDYRDAIPMSDFQQLIIRSYNLYNFIYHTSTSIEKLEELEELESNLLFLLSHASTIYKEEVKNVKDFINTDKKIRKQLDNCPLKKEILEFINIKIQKYEEIFKINVDDDDVKNFVKRSVDVDRYLLKRLGFIIYDFVVIYISVMDVYTLARMFRTFKKTSQEDPENIIVYVGDGHAKTYYGFLEYIKARNVIKKPYSSNNYIQFYPEDKAKSFLFN